MDIRNLSARPLRRPILVFWLIFSGLCGLLEATAVAGAFVASPAGAFNPDNIPPSPGMDLENPKPTTDSVRRWNGIALDAVGIDSARYNEQAGPTRSSRALAIVQIAVFDAVNAIAGGYESYTELPPAPPNTSFDAAVAQAAHDTLVALYPAQTARFDFLLGQDLRRIPLIPRIKGVALGKDAATAILALRTGDGSQLPEPPASEFASDEPGRWRPDPISMIPIALGGYWDQVKPFVLDSASQFRPGPPPGLTSPQYTGAYKEVKKLGGAGKPITPTARTLQQTLTGIYWSYDGTPFLGTPPREYNQITVRIADLKGTKAVPLARLLALINVAMADAAIAGWEAKYHYLFWRPITAIRDADTDGNFLTVPDPGFTPLGAQASNLPDTPDFTPPFPSYPSGHAVLCSAVFDILRQFYGTDRIAFSFVSDELNGKTLDFAPPYPPNYAEPPGYIPHVRPYSPRSYGSLSQAEAENGQSRIYLGVHWNFDVSQGALQGWQIGDFVYAHKFQPVASP